MANTATDIIIKSLQDKYGSETTEKLVNYLDLILDRNQFINLTAVKDRDEAIEKHIADSLSICELPEYVEAKNIIDIGTGGGFPGVLLAIASPDKEFVLVDSTLKRLKVIDEFAEKIGINNVTTVHARAEELQRKDDFGGCFDLCVSRAVANLTTLSDWCIPFVKKDGYFISYKGENYMEEVEGAAKTLKKRKAVVDRVVTVESDIKSISGHVLLVIKKK